MNQLHRWSLAVSDVASAFCNTAVDQLKGLILVEAPKEVQYLELTILETQTSALWSQRFTGSWQIHLTQVLQKIVLLQMRSDPCASQDAIHQVMSTS